MSLAFTQADIEDVQVDETLWSMANHDLLDAVRCVVAKVAQTALEELQDANLAGDQVKHLAGGLEACNAILTDIDDRIANYEPPPPDDPS